MEQWKSYKNAKGKAQAEETSVRPNTDVLYELGEFLLSKAYLVSPAVSKYTKPKRLSITDGRDANCCWHTAWHIAGCVLITTLLQQEKINGRWIKFFLLVCNKCIVQVFHAIGVLAEQPAAGHFNKIFPR